jgi:hypothetical protein
VTFEFPSQLDSIGDGAFAQCGFESLSIPASVRSIGQWCFEACPNLSQVQFAPASKLAQIHSCLFPTCRSLKSVVIPESVMSRMGFQLLASQWGQFIVVEPDFATAGFETNLSWAGIKSRSGGFADLDDESYAGYEMMLHDLIIDAGGRQIVAPPRPLLELFCGSSIRH